MAGIKDAGLDLGPQAFESLQIGRHHGLGIPLISGTTTEENRWQLIPASSHIRRNVGSQGNQADRKSVV